MDVRRVCRRAPHRRRHLSVPIGAVAGCWDPSRTRRYSGNDAFFVRDDQWQTNPLGKISKVRNAGKIFMLADGDTDFQGWWDNWSASGFR